MPDVAGSRARQATVSLYKEDFKFSSAHFTIFSATDRERLHGHNFKVTCALTGQIGPNDFIADYRQYKTALRAACDELDEYMLLPDRSPYLQIERDGDYVIAIFDGQRMPFLATDVLVLPVANVTLEALSKLLLDRLITAGGPFGQAGLTEVVVTASSGPGQHAEARWTAG